MLKPAEQTPLSALRLGELIQEGWSHSWGVYLHADGKLEDVRHHLRRFLLVKHPQGKPVYFRFYDPRVLRVYLQTCTSDEITQVFGPIPRIVAESSALNGNCPVSSSKRITPRL